MNYFSVSSKVFDLGLSPSELMVYCAISSVKNPLSYAVCGARAIAGRTGLSERTTYRAVESLQSKGLIIKRNRYRYDGTRASNGYTVAQIGGRKFTVDRTVWAHQLDASSFAVYLYLQKTAHNTTCDAYPSLNKLSAALTLCKNTIIAKIKLLQERMLVFKCRRTSAVHGGNICNQHILLTFFSLLNLNRAKKKERTAMRSSCDCSNLQTQPKICNRISSVFSLARICELFKRGGALLKKFTNWSRFIGRGSSFLAEQVLYPLKLQQKKK